MRHDRLRLDDILEAIGLIEEFLQGKSRHDLDTDRMLQSALLHQLVLIGESANAVSDSIKNKYTHIPWKVIYGFRNHIAHEYFSLDIDIVWNTLVGDVPKLKEQVSEIIHKEFGPKKD